MEDQKNEMRGKSCSCGCANCDSRPCGCTGWGWHGRHSVFRILIGLAIIFVIACIAFAVGVKLGEFRATFGGFGWHARYDGGYGAPMMMRGWNGYGGYYNGYYAQPRAQAAAPAAASSTAPAAPRTTK